MSDPEGRRSAAIGCAIAMLLGFGFAFFLLFRACAPDDAAPEATFLGGFAEAERVAEAFLLSRPEPKEAFGEVGAVRLRGDHLAVSAAPGSTKVTLAYLVEGATASGEAEVSLERRGGTWEVVNLERRAAARPGPAAP